MASEQCAHEPCQCTVGTDGGIQADDGRGYCSEGCRDGKGCDHPDCACRMDIVDGDSSAVPML